MDPLILISLFFLFVSFHFEGKDYRDEKDQRSNFGLVILFSSTRGA